MVLSKAEDVFISLIGSLFAHAMTSRGQGCSFWDLLHTSGQSED